jgi:dihydroxy-acid dehydratase
MGACSVDLPTLVISGGPMMKGKFKGKEIGTSDVWRFAEAYKLGELTQKEFIEAEACMARTPGHCAVMGTASTMATMVEALGLSLPQNAAIPAADVRRKVLAQHSGRRIVEMVNEDLKMSKVLTRPAFENAIRVNAATGGSTNFVIHLTAIAGRLGVDLKLDDFDEFSRNIPLLANIQPSGEHFMEDLYYAGGLPALMNQMKEHLHTSIVTVNGKTVGENIENTPIYESSIISTFDAPFKPDSGIAVVRGNLAPNGAVLKPSAASKELFKHRGKAVVFENIEDYHARIDSDELEVDENSVMVLKNVGPKGYPGMAEVGNMGIPKKLLQKGVKDMVRISDGRMSGTGFGTVILHVSPESAAGGPLNWVQNGDYIALDVENRTINWEVSEEELAARKVAHPFEKPKTIRGYVGLFIDHVEQADQGADFDFLKGGSGSVVTRDSH